jgi:hypothetical protein
MYARMYVYGDCQCDIKIPFVSRKNIVVKQNPAQME